MDKLAVVNLGVDVRKESGSAPAELTRRTRSVGQCIMLAQPLTA